MMEKSDRPCPCGRAAASVVPLGSDSEALRCARCGLLARSQMVSEAALTKWYREAYWTQDRTERLAAAWHNVYVHVLDWLEHVHPQVGTLVDVGCGTGALLALGQQRGWR